jgi:hypothetical protein
MVSNGVDRTKTLAKKGTAMTREELKSNTECRILPHSNHPAREFRPSHRSGDERPLFAPGRHGLWSSRCGGAWLRVSLRMFFLILVAPLAAQAAPAESFPVTIQVDAAQRGDELRPIWRFFGADEPNYAYMRDGKKLLGELGRLRPREVYFRTHNLLNSGDGTPALKWGSTGVYRQDAEGRPIYDWTILDRIFDAYLERGVRPYVQIGFMPKGIVRETRTLSARLETGRSLSKDLHGMGLPAE